MALAWTQRYRQPAYRLVRPLSFTAVDAADWMFSLRDADGARIWLRLRDQDLGDDGRKHIARHWHWLRHCFYEEIRARGRLEGR